DLAHDLLGAEHAQVRRRLFRATLAFAHLVAEVRGVGARPFHDVLHVPADGLRRDAVFQVVGYLFFTPALRLFHGAFHGARDGIGVKNRPAIQVARGAAHGLDQRVVRTQETFLVG